MSIQPYPIHVYRKGSWTSIQTDHLLPGDLISLTRQSDESPVPVDCLLLDGACIANEAMLSGESTPQMKESISQRDLDETLDMAIDKNHGTSFF